MNITLNLAVVGLSVIAVVAMITNHDGSIVQACIGGIMTICGYTMFALRKNGNGKETTNGKS